MKLPLYLLMSTVLGFFLSMQAVSAFVVVGDLGLKGDEDTDEVDPVDNGEYDEGDHYCEGASHEHTHYQVESDTPTQEFWGVVHSFAIVFEDDFLDTVDTSSMLCGDSGSFDRDGDGDYDNTYQPCGFDKDADLGDKILVISGGRWSGVSVTYQILSWIDGNPKGLLWEYGTSDLADIDLKPWLAGGQKLVEGISFELNDYFTDQTVTTTSWTKMEYYYFDLTGNDDYTDLSNWHSTYTDTIEPVHEDVDPDGDYIYWYGINGTAVSNVPACGVSCSNLSIDPSSLSVSNVFNDTNFSLNATDSDGNDITADVSVTYEAFQYDGTPSTGDVMTGWLVNTANNGSGPVETGDMDIKYSNSLPGDRLTACVSDFEGRDYCGTGICEVEIEFPYCSNLDFTHPAGFPAGYGGSQIGNTYENNLEIDVDSSSGEDWPFDVTYESTDSNATFDGNSSPYTTDDWTIDSYVSTEEGFNTVSVGLDDENNDGLNDDVANLCSDDFLYKLSVPEEECEILEITVPDHTLTCEEMEAGDIEVTWESTMTDGSAATGPWELTSSNPAGTFSLTSGGTVVGTGAYTSSVTTLYYNGDPGDTISVTDPTYPVCTDSIGSETCGEVEICEDLTLSDPYITNSDGSTTTIDLTDSADLETLYNETLVCWDFTLNVSDAGYSGTLVAAGYEDATASTYNGTLSLTVNETAGTDIGNPVSEGISGFTNYTGTLCWENFEEGNYLSVSMLGEELLCSDKEELPPLEEEALYCIDLELKPDAYTMSAEQSDAGTVTLTTEVTGSDSTWTGTLIIEHTGSGELFYSDASPSEFGDGHLEIPVSGISTTVTVTYVGGDAGDTVTAYIENEEGNCTDNLSITQELPPPENLFCVDLELDPDSYTLDAEDEEAGEIESTVEIEGYDSNWTGLLIVETDGDGELFYSNGDASEFSDGNLEISVSGTSATVTFTYEGGQEGDTVTATIEDEENLCSDEYSIEQEEEIPVCVDVDFKETEVQVDFDCEDVSTEICVEGDSDDEREIEICYDGEEGFEFEGEMVDDKCEDFTLEIDEGETECFDITFYEVCEEDEITVLEDGEVCEELDVEEIQMGEFTKSIFTFNFDLENDPLADENVFFAHDEDRAFYTLEYSPSGDESEAIVFTDDMWGSGLIGTEGGAVSLASTEEELTSGRAFTYTTITNMGFGCPEDANGNPDESLGPCHELNSQTIAESIDGSMVFVPYLKYENDSESSVIEACSYDSDDKLLSEDVCYNSDHSPETTGDVVIENAGAVENASIRIRYVGVIQTGLSCDDTTDECLTEEFENEAEVKVFESMTSLESSARLVVLCSYLLTQNAGDIYLEVELTTGSDISCIFVDEETSASSYANSDALVILEVDDAAVSSSYKADYSSTTLSFCDSDSSNNRVSNLSSYICEIVNAVSELWKKTTVESTTESHVSQATRNAETNQGAETNGPYSWDALVNRLTNKNNPDSHILYFNGDLSSTKVLILEDLIIAEGAWTLIVENADLRIEGDISYVGTQGNYADISSVAFIVLGGDIDIDNGPTELVGVYYTNQVFTGDPRSAVDEPLTVNGSLYGNIQALLEAAQYVGPPTIDGGGLVIKYDSRILLNTPPGLSEYVDVSTEQAIN